MDDIQHAESPKSSPSTSPSSSTSSSITTSTTTTTTTTTTSSSSSSSTNKNLGGKTLTSSTIKRIKSLIKPSNSNTFPSPSIKINEIFQQPLPLHELDGASSPSSPSSSPTSNHRSKSFSSTSLNKLAGATAGDDIGSSTDTSGSCPSTTENSLHSSISSGSGISSTAGSCPLSSQLDMHTSPRTSIYFYQSPPVSQNNHHNQQHLQVHQQQQHDNNNNNNNNSSHRKTPPSHNGSYLKYFLPSINPPSSPRSTSSSKRNFTPLQPINRSISVVNLKNESALEEGIKHNNKVTSGSSSSAGTSGHGSPVVRPRSHSEVTLPSWESTSYEGDFSSIIQETLSRALSQPHVQLSMLKSSTFDELDCLANGTKKLDLEDQSHSSNNGRTTTNTDAHQQQQKDDGLIVDYQGNVIAGKLEKIVGLMTDISNYTGTQHVEDVLYTYHYYLKDYELLQLLWDRFNDPLGTNSSSSSTSSSSSISTISSTNSSGLGNSGSTPILSTSSSLSSSSGSSSPLTVIHNTNSTSSLLTPSLLTPSMISPNTSANSLSSPSILNSNSNSSNELISNNNNNTTNNTNQQQQQLPTNEKAIEQMTNHIKFRVINVLKKWVEGHGYDFSSAPLYKLFLQFLEVIIKFNNKWGNHLKKSVSTHVIKYLNAQNLSTNGGTRESSQSLRDLVPLHDIETLATIMMRALTLKERKKKLKTIRASFTGSEAVDWIVHRYELQLREDAVDILLNMLKADLIRHHSESKKSVEKFKDKDSSVYFFPSKAAAEALENANNDAYPEVLLPKQLLPTSTFLDVHPVEIARQLTLIEFTLYCKITPSDLHHQAWNKPGASEKVPNIMAFIKRSNSVSYWVATEILLERNVKQRITVLKRFITIAEILLKLNNWNTLMGVMLGLNLGSIQRLKKTWEGLPRNMLDSFEFLTQQTSASQNYANYRKAMSVHSFPCLPYMAVYLRDLVFIEDANQDVLPENGYINFSKMQMISKILTEIHRFQTVPYHLKKVDSIAKMLQQTLILSDKDLYKASNICEQPTRTMTMSSLNPKTLERKKSFFPTLKKGKEIN